MLQESEKVSILLVDDQPARLMSYEAILSDLGQKLVSAGSGTEALELLLKGDFAVILLDVSMPGMDGFETAAMIHNHPRYERTPIIFVTGVHVSELDRLKGYKLGAVDYVSIPIVADILRSKVNVLVELHCQRRQLQELNISLAAANERLERANTTLQAEKTRELEVLNQALQQSNRHKDEFLAILAHELRNPLAPIRNAVDIMKRVPIQDSSLAWSRDVIGRQATHLTRLVDDLLDISRITHGTIRLNRDTVTVKSIVDRALEAVQPAIQERQHELQVDLAEPGIVVSGDLIRLVQVLSNLLTNAAKYTPPGGRIGLDVRCSGGLVEFRVSDSGIGISKESLPRLFNLFSRVSHQHGHGESGLGIGLALVRRLVELHDGQVSVRSDGENRGSEFLVTLPIVDVRESADDAPALGESGTKQRRRILVVDDNLDALNSIALLLEMAGHEVFEAPGGIEGLKLAGEKLPDTAILDIGMPVMNGFELARRIRAEPWGKPMHLIALSGWGQHEDKRRARDAGFDHHLVKPVSFEAVSELINGLTG